jgi:CTP:molybdopterin cytidylyltransferase MocA
MIAWAVVHAAGSGERFGGSKQFRRGGESRMVDLAVAAASAARERVVLVLAPHIAWDVGNGADVDCVVSGGCDRSISSMPSLAAHPQRSRVRSG